MKRLVVCKMKHENRNNKAPLHNPVKAEFFYEKLEKLEKSEKLKKIENRI